MPNVVALGSPSRAGYPWDPQAGKAQLSRGRVIRFRVLLRAFVAVMLPAHGPACGEGMLDGWSFGPRIRFPPLA